MSDVSKEYGGALFELALEEGLDFEILDQIQIVREILKNNPEYIKLLDAPNIAKDERLGAVDQAFRGRVHEYLCSFLKLLTERGRIREIFSCADEYETRYYENKGLVVAEVQSAVELTDKQKNAVLAKLEKSTGRDVELKCRVNPSLIGGMRILVNGALYEGSVKAKLNELRGTLTGTTL